jgi:hypothetical protein
MHRAKKTGRPPRLLKCRLCGLKDTSTAIRLHEPTCRRAHLLKVGARFTVMLNTRIVPVMIEQFLDGEGGMVCRNLDTGRRIKVKSPRRFREWMDTATVRFARPNKKGPQE